MSRESQRRPQEPHRNYSQRLAHRREARFKARINRRLIKAQRERDRERLRIMRIGARLRKAMDWFRRHWWR